MITPILVFIYDRKKKASPKRAASVELRLTLERKSKYISTGVRLLPKEWHKGTVVNRPDSAELNELLGTIMVRARKVTNAMIEAGNLNLDEIPRRMDELTKDKRLFYDFCVERTKVRIYGKSKDTAARYDRFLDWLKKWGKIIYFSDVTDRNIIKMDEELSAIGMKNYSKWNNYHRFLNSFIIDAMDEGFLKRNPYKWVHINKEKNNGLKKHLTFEEFSKLQRAKMPTTSLERVRDLFVFQTFTCMSYVDLENFDVSMINSAGVYTAKRGKTGVEFSFFVMKPARDILEKYNGKLPLISNVKYNDYLKLVAQAAGIEKPITSHWARHTGATILLNDGGVEMEVISRILGHTSTRQTRETYAKLLDTTVVTAMKGLEKRIAKK
jgi:site-specific recombinase XerD